MNESLSIRSKLIRIVAILMAAFHIYTAATIVRTPLVQNPVHLAFGLMLSFLFYTGFKKSQGIFSTIADTILIVLTVIVNLHVALVFAYPETLERLFTITLIDKIYGTILILLILEATRRVLGIALVWVALAFLGYFYLGPYIPGPLGHAGFSFTRLINSLYVGTDGIYGVVLSASASYLFMIVLLGGFLLRLGAGQFFIDMALVLVGRLTGGPAKVAVIASAFFGTITGNGPANVAATGQITIPMMKKMGYRPNFAAAVEATASTGGQIMPPVMGTAAFIMAEFLGVPYATIMAAALIPAVLYFASIFFVTHLEARRTGLKGLPKEEIPNFKETIIKGWHFILPILVLVFMVARQISLARASLYAILCLVIVDLIKNLLNKKLDLESYVEAFEEGAKTGIVITTASAAVGIVIGIISLTGIGFKLSAILVNFASGSLPLLLVFTMIASLILGVGLTTVACYIILAIVAAPALIKLGVVDIGAHLFVFYFGIISAITPPVALAAYVGAGIAKSDPFKTALTASKLGIAAFIVPYMFVSNPKLLMIGGYNEIIISFIIALFGLFAVISAVWGYLLNELKIIERLLFLASGVILIWTSSVLVNLIGFVLLALVLGFHIWRLKGTNNFADQNKTA